MYTSWDDETGYKASTPLSLFRINNKIAICKQKQKPQQLDIKWLQMYINTTNLYVQAPVIVIVSASCLHKIEINITIVRIILCALCSLAETFPLPLYTADEDETHAPELFGYGDYAILAVQKV